MTIAGISDNNSNDKELARVWYEFWDGLNFLLSHFMPGQESLFPRNISTAATGGGQKTVDDRGRMELYFQGAVRQDCRVSAYPNYEVMKEKGLLTATYKPKVSLLFIDLDIDKLDYQGSNETQQLEALKKAVDDTLENISEHFNGAVPTVLWTGGGVHIYLPVDADYIPVYEELPEFAPFKDPSVKFMRYAEKRLTNGLSDKSHNTSFKSCMLRIPNSTNTKYQQQSDRSKVTIIQRWNGKRARPTKKLMLTDFHAYLVQEVIDRKVEELRMQRRYHNNKKLANAPTSHTSPTSSSIKLWIEKLLETPISDYRKTARDLILIPYLIVDKGMTDRDQIYNIIMEWADRCDRLRKLEPSRRDFSVRVRSRIEEVMRDKVPPMRLDTLRENNLQFYQTLNLGRFD